MMLAEAEHVEADAIGEFDLLHDIGEALVDIDRLARSRIAPGLDDSVGAELHERPRQRALPGAGEAMLASRQKERDAVTEPPISRYATPGLTDLPDNIRERSA